MLQNYLRGAREGPLLFIINIYVSSTHGCSSILFQLCEFSDSCVAVEDATCLQEEGNKEEMEHRTAPGSYKESLITIN